MHGSFDRFVPAFALSVLSAVHADAAPAAIEPAPTVRAFEQQRIDTIARVAPAVVCILDAQRSGGGSGVLIDADGHCLTNFHVVAELLATRRGFAGLSDGSLYPLEVLGIDPTGDVAMVRLRSESPLPCVELGDSDTVRVGDWALAMGNPFFLAEDFTPTVTLGIVSGVHRYQGGTAGHQLVYTDCIQVDTSINPGNSGGPLFDSAGRLIGINGRAAFEERGRVNVGLGFAISINQIKRFLPALRAGHQARHGSLGATVTDSGFQRVVFDAVAAGSPAARAGIRVGERLYRFDGHAIHSANQLLNWLGTYPNGWPVTIECGSETARRTLRVDLAPVPTELIDGYTFEDALIVEPAATADTAARLRASNSFSSVIDATLPSIVKLYGAGVASVHGYGTGVVVSEDGEVVTTLSLLLETSDLRAVTADGRLWHAEVTRRDPARQLALLALRANEPAAPDRFVVLAPASSTTLTPGDWVVAFANPFKVAEGDEPASVLKGVFSARVPLDARLRAQPFPYRGEVLVVDAITSTPGSPGGALTDLDGQWVGLLGEIVFSARTNTRLNYAIPIEEVAAFLREVRAGDSTSPASKPIVATAGPGYHGIHLFALGYRRRLPFVERVEIGSPAEQAGLRRDDLILRANDTPTHDARAFTRVCETLGPGETLILVVKRGDAVMTFPILLREVPQ